MKNTKNILFAVQSEKTETCNLQRSHTSHIIKELRYPWLFVSLPIIILRFVTRSLHAWLANIYR